tara:strand:- start:768 stop:1205 length:438 start_codon:yes stop_codon:yes gene_type:complete
MEAEKVINYLTYLAVNRQVITLTQNLVLYSMVFMYKYLNKLWKKHNRASLKYQTVILSHLHNNTFSEFDAQTGNINYSEVGLILGWYAGFILNMSKLLTLSLIYNRSCPLLPDYNSMDWLLIEKPVVSDELQKLLGSAGFDHLAF